MSFPVDVVESTSAPCPTAVLAGDVFFSGEIDDEAAHAIARAVSAELSSTVTKIALVATTPNARRHAFDFIQIRRAAGRGDVAIERGGNCGNSMLAAGCVLLQRPGGEPRLDDAREVWVELMHTTTRVRAEVRALASSATPDALEAVDVTLTHSAAGRGFSSCLLGPAPRWRARLRGDEVEVTTLDFFNPYVFVAADAFGIDAARLLTATGQSAPLAQARELRRTVTEALGLPRDSEYPKLAVVAVGADSMPVVRTVYLDGWHPVIALTGVASFAVARGIAGSVVHGLCGPLASDGALYLQTPREVVRFEIETTDDGDVAVTIPGRHVIFHERRMLAALGHDPSGRVASRGAWAAASPLPPALADARPPGMAQAPSRSRKATSYDNRV